MLALATVGVTLLALIPVFQLWNARMDVPFTYTGDATFYSMTIENVVENGWYERTERLGAPFGLELHDFPLGGDNLHFALVRILTAFSSEPGVVLNIYLLLTFPLVALTSLFVLRWLGISRLVSLVFAVVYTFLPYHLYRGVSHLFLSGYFAVPIGAYLALAILLDRPLFSRRPDRAGVFAFASRRTLLTLAGCAVLGSAGSYYVAFTVLLVAAAAAAQCAKHRSLSPLIRAGVVTVAIAGVLSVNLAPSVLYRQRHGSNTEVAHRHPSESERYGLKLTALVLPQADHRLAPLGAVAEHYRDNTPVPSEGGQALGLLGTIGLLWLLGVAGMTLLGGATEAAASPVQRALAALTLVSLLTGMIGGFSVLINFLMTPQFRSWNRISVFIAFFALASLALLIDVHRRPRQRSTTAGLVVLLLLALFDQTTSAAVPTYARTAAEFDSDRAFVRSIESLLPEGASVFQLPFMPFPEAQPVVRMKDYDPLRGYLHSHRLRWSYGGMRGREADWQKTLAGQPMDLVTLRLAVSGFAGIYVDRFGYLDSAKALESEIARVVGGPTLVSDNGRFSFFSLADSVRALSVQTESTLGRLESQTLRPIQTRPGFGFSSEQEDGDSWSLLGTRQAELKLFNPDQSPRRVVLDTTLNLATAGQIQLVYPDGRIEEFPVSDPGFRLSRVMVLPGGSHSLKISTNTGPLTFKAPMGPVYMTLLNPALYDQPPATSGVTLSGG
jgi:phosphoglycerol transferase